MFNTVLGCSGQLLILNTVKVVWQQNIHQVEWISIYIPFTHHRFAQYNMCQNSNISARRHQLGYLNITPILTHTNILYTLFNQLYSPKAISLIVILILCYDFTQGGRIIMFHGVIQTFDLIGFLHDNQAPDSLINILVHLQQKAISQSVIIILYTITWITLLREAENGLL